MTNPIDEVEITKKDDYIEGDLPDGFTIVNKTDWAETKDDGDEVGIEGEWEQFIKHFVSELNVGTVDGKICISGDIHDCLGEIKENSANLHADPEERRDRGLTILAYLDSENTIQISDGEIVVAIEDSEGLRDGLLSTAVFLEYEIQRAKEVKTREKNRLSQLRDLREELETEIETPDSEEVKEDIVDLCGEFIWPKEIDKPEIGENYKYRWKIEPPEEVEDSNQAKYEALWNKLLGRESPSLWKNFRIIDQGVSTIEEDIDLLEDNIQELENGLPTLREAYVKTIEEDEETFSIEEMLKRTNNIEHIIGPMNKSGREPIESLGDAKKHIKGYSAERNAGLDSGDERVTEQEDSEDELGIDTEFNSEPNL